MPLYQKHQNRCEDSHISRNKSKALVDWNPDDKFFWVEKGSRIARRNLLVSIPCLLISFSVWMIFSVVAMNLPQAGFAFTTDQLFLLTALPSLSGAFGRIPYSFVIPIFGGRRWTAFSTLLLIIPMSWLSIAVQDKTTPYETFLIISLLCGFGGANFASSMANISLFYPKNQQGKALGLNGGLGNLGVSLMQVFVPIVISLNIFGFWGPNTESTNSDIWLENASLIWIPLILILTIASWSLMNDISTPRASFKEQWSILKQHHLWILSILYLATFGSFIGFSAGFAMLAKTQFSDVDIMKYAFIGPFFGALMRPVGGVLSDKFGGIKITFISFCLMAILVAILFSTLPSNTNDGSFTYFLIVFMALFSCAGAGSGSTFQMIAVLFRGMMIKRNIKRCESEEQAVKKSANDTATALGFISAIGAIGGFFIPNAFGLSIALSGTPINAMTAFLIFYVICGLMTWFIYGKELSN